MALLRSTDAQTLAWGRFSLYVQSSRSVQDGGFSSTVSDYIGSFTLRSSTNENGGFEYAVDARGADYTGAFQQTQVSIYDAYVGYRTQGGGFGLRLGQMWLNDLGALGAFGGVLGEYRSQPTSVGRFRFGLFAGLEPNLLTAGFVNGVKKGGGYAALDGHNGGRLVLGLVGIRNNNVTERQVATLLGFLPGGTRFFAYGSAEYDIKGPAGTSNTGLNYYFASIRYAPSQTIDFQGTFHHGLSIDARTITNDEINGRPVDPRLLTGFLYESAGGRVTVMLSNHVRAWGGYARDKTNMEAQSTGRVNAGFWASNIFGTHLDFTVSDNRFTGPTNRYDSWYTSLGASLGRSVYLSADYTTSLSTVTFTDSGGVVVTSRPQTKRYSLSSNINLSRTFSLMLTVERIKEDTGHQDRGIAGFSVRF